MKKKLFILPFTFILTTALFSCSNILDASLSKQASDYSITGYVSPYDFAETAPSKSAFPTVPDSATILYYTVTATHGSTSVSENVQGTNGAQFNLKLPSIGDWSVTATCFGTDSSRATVVYKTVKPQVISVTNASPSKFANLTLKPLMTSGKTGTLNLEIDGTGLDSSFFPSTIKVECISRNLPDMDDRISASFDIPTKIYTLKTKNGQALPSGSYTFNINFITTSKNLYFYSVTETVNIYDGLETNRWVKNGDEEYITSDGKFELTDAIVNKFQQESIYVDSSATSDNVSGSWIDPYQSLDAAIDRLKANPSIKTIFVSGKHTTSKTLDFSNDGNVTHDLTIKKNPRATAKPVIKTTTTSSFIEGGRYKIVLENIDFKGCGNEVGATPAGSLTGSTPSEKGGAFLHFPSATGSAEITNCTISDYYSDKGGAICAGANSTTTLTNVDITRCKATKGGAISLYGSLTFYGGSITDCNNGSIYAETTSPFLKIIDVTIENCNNSTDTTPLINAAAATNEFTKVTIKDCHNNGEILSSGTSVILTGCSITDCSTNGNYSTLISLGGNINLIDTAINGEGDGKKIISTADSNTVYVSGSTSITNGTIFFNGSSKVTIIGELTAEKCATLKKNSPDYQTNPQILDCDIDSKTAAENAEILKASVPKFSYDGTFEISETGLILPVAYVDGTNGKTKAAGGNGSKDNPFNQVNEAVQELKVSVGENNALIYVAGTTLENDSISTAYSAYNYLTNLVIKQWPGKSKAVIKRGATHTDSIIKADSYLTLEDIDIDGNNVVLTDKNGAGIYIDGEGSATLTNVKIYGCKVKQETTPAAGENLGQGGAIFVKTTTNTSGSSSLVLKGNTVIGSDIAGTLSEGNCSNMAHDGGAIYYYNINSTNLRIEESVIIKGNYASANGGAIHLNYRYAYLSGTITNNKAGNAGGAIYSYKGFVKGTGTISGNTSSMGSIYSVVSSNTNEYIYLNSKTNIGPDDEIVLGYDRNNSSNFGRIYFDEELSSQTNPIKVSCENPVATAKYVSGKTINLIESEILNLSYNGIFRFITSGDNRGKLETAPVYVAGTTGNNSNPGTEAEPLATVASAVNKIKDFGGTIYVAGTTTETSSIAITTPISSKSFTISQWEDKTTAKIKRANSQTSYMIKIGNNNNVTIKDIEIDGSNISVSSSGESAGINIVSNGTLTLENVDIHNVIRSNASSPVGGAIYAEGSFTMIGGSIKDCIIGPAASPAGSGGAIYKKGAAYPCVLENVTFSGNKAAKGNGIYVASGSITLKGSTNLSTSTGDINDIYLYNSDSSTGSIKIDGTLSAATVAQITIPVDSSGNITRTDAVLVPKTATSYEVKNSYEKFIINLTNYELVQDGMLAPIIRPAIGSNLSSLVTDQFTAGYTTVIAEIGDSVNLNNQISIDEDKALYIRAKQGSTSPTITNNSTSDRMFFLNPDSKLIVTDVTLDGNDVTVTGAGSIIYVSGGTLTLNGNTKITNGLCVPTESFTGGAIYSTPAGSIYITDNVIISNNKTNDENHMGTDIELSGGGICAKGPLYISGNAKITENSVRNDVQYEKIYGAGIYSSNSLTITDNVEISDNYLELRKSGMYANGAGICIGSGSLSINGTDVKINNNHVNVYGELTGTHSCGIGIEVPTSTQVSLEGNITVTGNSTQTDDEYDSGYGICTNEVRPPVGIHYEAGSGGIRVYENSKNGESPDNKQYFSNRS